MRISTLLCCALLGGVALVAHAQSNPALVGRWTMVESNPHFADGRVVPQRGLKCASEYTPVKVISECELPNGNKSRVVFNYKWLERDTYELEILENNRVQTSVGSRHEAEYRVADGKLTSIAFPPPNPNGVSISRVESVLVREPAK
jgi:hypothetical protein